MHTPGSCSESGEAPHLRTDIISAIIELPSMGSYAQLSVTQRPIVGEEQGVFFGFENGCKNLSLRGAPGLKTLLRVKISCAGGLEGGL
jgi:hypothetical protein